MILANIKMLGLSAIFVIGAFFGWHSGLYWNNVDDLMVERDKFKKSFESCERKRSDTQRSLEEARVVQNTTATKLNGLSEAFRIAEEKLQEATQQKEETKDAQPSKSSSTCIDAKWLRSIPKRD